MNTENPIGDFNPDDPSQITDGEHVEDKRFTKEEVDKRRFNPTLDYAGPDYLFEYMGTPVFALGGIAVIAAAEKNGKSLYSTLLCGAALKGEYMGYKCLKENVKIIYFDTEMEVGDTAFLQRRVHHIAGYDYHVPHVEFQVFNLLTDSPEDRKAFVRQVIQEENPDLVIVDGVADLVKNLNDYDSCYDLVQDQISMAAQNHMLIFDLIHTNHGSDKMQGWLGTILAKKEGDCIRLTKFKSETTDATFKVEQISTRHRDIRNMQFKMDGSKLGVPVSLTEIEKKNVDALDEVVHKYTIKNGRGEDTTKEMTLRELIELDTLFRDKMGEEKWSLQEAKSFTGKGSNLSYQLVQIAIGKGIIERNQYNKYYYVGRCEQVNSYTPSTNNNQETKQEEAPF